jgi:hypothetical protein
VVPKNSTETMRPCLLLASSLTVADPRFLRANGRHSPEQRLADTATALNFWLTRQTAYTNLVFVDNSGDDLGALRAKLPAAPGREVEFLSFQTSGYDDRLGRSFGELDIMRHALAHSKIVAAHTHLAKVNARLHVANADALAAAMPEDFDVVGRLSHNLTWLATTFVAFRRSVFEERILPYALTHVDDYARNHIERVYAKATLQAISLDLRWYPFPVEPQIIGRRGLDNGRYGANPLRRGLIDIAIRGYHRAFDQTADRSREHPQANWSKPREDSE